MTRTQTSAPRACGNFFYFPFLSTARSPLPTLAGSRDTAHAAREACEVRIRAAGREGASATRARTCLVASACASCLRPARRVSASRPLGRLAALTSAGPRGAGAPQSQAPAREPLAFPAARLRASSFKKAPRPRGRGGRRQGAREERRPRPKSLTTAASGARRAGRAAGQRAR